VTQISGVDRVSGSRVLVVEDDAAVRSVITRGLKRAGYTVLEQSGMERVNFEPLPQIDVLVCDVVLPAEPGNSVAQRCKTKWPNCEIFLLSGHSPDEVAERGVPAGATLVQKPVTPRTIADLIDKALTARAWRALRTDAPDE
jgi:CheY-like chemotaxis protein